MFFEEEEVKNTNEEHYIWAEKFRPSEMEEYLGNEALKAKMTEYIDDGQIPHLLFHSKSPGTGKTSMAKLLASKIKCDVMYINAADESGIDVIRQKVTGFASTLGFNKLKILILDESQRITVDGQKALLNTMETFSKHTRFILTCNDIERLDKPLVSRCQVYHVQPPEKSDVARYVAGILDKSGVTYKPENFKALMKYYPDIRRIIQTAQQNSVNGVLNINEKEVLESDSKLKLVSLLTDKSSKKDKLVNIRQLMLDTGLTNFDDYYTYLFENVDTIAPGGTSSVITTLADYQYKDAFAINKELNFAACMVELLKMM